MTEWEKMLAGLPQNDRAPELEARRLVAKRLFRAYNKTTEDDAEVREEIKRQLFRSVGKNVFIEPDFICEMGNNIAIGDNVFIAPNVCIITEEHAMDIEQRRAGLEYARPVTIGDDVWIATGVLVLPGVTIGDGCVIGAGSVVVKDIPPHSLAAGNPCRVIRRLD